jgi:hypothetical protein
MVKLNRINQNTINHKGQSLVEAAVFGSLLLLVLGFLLDYGLRYNYGQQVKMEAFRRALKMAGESDLVKSQDIVLIKDVHIPNPSDMFALGVRSPFKGSASIFWGNKSSDLDYYSLERTPSVNYNFNPDNNFEYGFFPSSAWQNANINRTYTTSNVVNANGAITTIGPLILRGVYDPYPGSPGKIYDGEDGTGPKEVMILMNAGGDCEDVYCPKTILDEATLINRGARDYYPVFDATGNAGETPSVIRFTDSEGGQINATLGYMQVDNKVIDKHRSLTLTENPTQYQSAETLNDGEAITHIIRTSSGDDSPTIVFRNEPVPTWTTSK